MKVTKERFRKEKRVKATKYAAKFLQDCKENQIGAVQKLVVSLMGEMLKLAELRHAKSTGLGFP